MYRLSLLLSSLVDIIVTEHCYPHSYFNAVIAIITYTRPRFTLFVYFQWKSEVYERFYGELSSRCN